MNSSIKCFILISAFLAASVIAAPTESPAGQENLTDSSMASTTSTASPSTTVATSTSDQTSSAPATDGSSKDTSNTTASMAVSSAHDNSSLSGSSSFTCYNRPIGYYADPEHSCKVYHFCLLGEYNGESVYQRISYLCLNSSIFDQQALDCVEPSKMSAPCAEAEKFYDSSNAILRQAIVGNSMHQGNGTETTKSVTASN